MSKLFISHSSQDDGFVRALRARLREQGHDGWIDSRELRGGDLLEAEVFRAIEGAEGFAVVVSPDACGGRNESGRKSGWRNWCDFLRLLPLRSPTIIFFRAAVAAIPCIDAGVVRSNRRAIAAICRSTFKSAKRSKPTNSALARAAAPGGGI